MNKMINLVVWVLLMIPISGCNDDDQVKPSIEAINAELVAAPEPHGTKQTVFEQNIDIYFSLKLINTSDVDVKAGSYYDFCSIYTLEEFLFIYKWAKRDEDDQESWVPLEKAYVPPVNCPDINIPAVIPANGELEVAGASWSNNPDNQPLGPGKYYTSLSYPLEIDGKSRVFDLILEFEVK